MAIQNKKNEKKEMTRPNSVPLLPPWGVQSCFSFVVFGFSFLFLDLLAGKTKNIAGPNSLPLLPPEG